MKTLLQQLAIALSTLAFAAVCNAAEYPVFKHFSDYVDMLPTKKSAPAICRAHFNAREKNYDRRDDPAYKHNKWKLVMRRGIFRSEVEKAMSEIYQYFLGYSTDLDFVENNGDYYIARREFKHFMSWEEATKMENSQYYVAGYLLKDDGTLTKGNEIKKLGGLAKIAVLTKFFADDDAEPFNFGVQVIGDQVRVIDFDNEHSLAFDEFNDDTDIEKQLALTLGEKFVNMPFFQQEKHAMLEKIAQTDFSVIENIIRKNITVPRLEEARWMFEKMLRDPTVFPEEDRAQARKLLDEANRLYNERKYGVDQIIDDLRLRHQQLREGLNRG